MAQKELKLNEIGDMDPRIALQLQNAVRDAVRDCMDRPVLKKTRKVTFTMSLMPVVDDRGDFEQAKIEFATRTTLPMQGTPTYHVRADRDGRLRYNTDDPTSSQPTLGFDAAQNEPDVSPRGDPG